MTGFVSIWTGSTKSNREQKSMVTFGMIGILMHDNISFPTNNIQGDNGKLDKMREGC